MIYSSAERAAIALDYLQFSPARREELLSRIPPQELFSKKEEARRVLDAREFAALEKWGEERTERLLADYARRGVVCVTRYGKDYPPALLALPDPPLVLYCEGDLSLLSLPGFAITGSRRTLPQIGKLTEEYARGISLKYAVVSCSSAGGDSAALRGALERRRAICVLAEGSLVAGPACNAPLFARLRKEGLLLSEFPPPFHAPVYRFSARNRIVAALSEAVLVVSAGEQSGTFFTANAARALGKPVYAFPYSPGIASGVGCNALLKDYAKCTDKLVDIAAAFGINLTETGSETLSEREEKALELLGQRPMHAAELAELLGEKPQELSALLTLLEMKGHVVSLGGNRYSLVR